MNLDLNYIDRVNEQENKILDDLKDCDSLLIVPQLLKESPFAERYLKKDTFEYYLVANQQYSIYPVEWNNTVPKLEDILNKDGLRLLIYVQMNVAKNNFKDTILNFNVDPSQSGRWYDTPESSYSSFYNKGNIGCTLNSWKNMVITGKSEASNERITTSPCIFINQDEGWCFTLSGSLYRLKNETNY